MRRKVRFQKMTQKRLESRCLIYNYSRLSRYEHLHSRFEMVSPASGRILARVDGKEYRLEPGDMLVVFPGMTHSYDPSETSEGYMLTFHSEMLGDLEESMMEVQPAEPLIHLSAHDRDVCHCFERLTEMAGGKVNETLAQAYLTLLFLRLPQIFGKAARGNGAKMSRQHAEGQRQRRQKHQQQAKANDDAKTAFSALFHLRGNRGNHLSGQPRDQTFYHDL